jgi:hypothetical protein
VESVRKQTVPVDHFVIADGPLRQGAFEAGLRHIQLDKGHGDYGCAARAIGCLLAVSEGYDAIGLLDAGNWLEPDHMRHCIDIANGAADGICDYVVARSRSPHSGDHRAGAAMQDDDEYIDADCLVFLRGSFHLLPIWAFLPKEAPAAGGRLFHRAVRESSLARAVTTKITVNLDPHPDLQVGSNSADARLKEWVDTLSPRELAITERQMGIALRSP